jgi:hypothetical protein
MVQLGEKSFQADDTGSLPPQSKNRFLTGLSARFGMTEF